MLKKISAITLLMLLTFLLSSCTSSDEINKKTTTVQTTKPTSTVNASEKPVSIPAILPNTPLYTDVFYADPSAHVFNGKLYIYPSHDIENKIKPDDDGSQYAMEDYHVLSIDDFTSSCVDNGLALHKKDVPWVKQQMWAPDAAFKNDKYYLYFPAKDKDDIFRIGVATSSSPTGPFTPEKNYIEGSFSIDPAVFTDTDGRSYMYFGGLMGGQLEKWTTGKFNKNAKAPTGSQAALGPKIAELSDDMLSFKAEPKDISIVDENGKPLIAKDENRRFFEAVWVHKYNDNYYLSYSTGTTHRIAYAMSKSPTGPFTYKGVILEPVKKGWTTHHSIVQFKDKWYLFYHDASVSGVDNKRSVKYTELEYNSDGTIKTITP